MSLGEVFCRYQLLPVAHFGVFHEGAAQTPQHHELVHVTAFFEEDVIERLPGAVHGFFVDFQAHRPILDEALQVRENLFGAWRAGGGMGVGEIAALRSGRPRRGWLLSGSDSIELMERIPEMADLPVIFISAYGRDETIARALEKGAVDYLVKSFVMGVFAQARNQ